MTINKCFGIISWFPDDISARAKRIARFDQLLQQLNQFWPTIPILIIAQNWKDYIPPKINNELIIHHAEKLGITKARQELRKTFLESPYDFIITLDDDTHFTVHTIKDAQDMISLIDKNPRGFSFRKGADTIPNSIYGPGHLIFAFLSRYIMEQLEMPDISASDEEGFEDSVYAHLCHYSYPELEFDYPKGININFFSMQSGIPSTWFTGSKNFNYMSQNTGRIIQYIQEHKTMPPLNFYSKRKE